LASTCFEFTGAGVRHVASDSHTVRVPLQGLTDFAIVQSYLDTATKWGLDKLDVLRQLFTTGAWLPPTLTPGRLRTAFEPNLRHGAEQPGQLVVGSGAAGGGAGATPEAAEVYRRLAGVIPNAFEPDLARGLWSFAWVRVAGEIELPQALTAAKESVTRYGELAQQLPQAFR
jgi:hypothetical protein